MSLFTSEHKIRSNVVTIRRTCQIGNDIWLIQRAYRHYFVMYRFNIDTNTLLPVEYNMIDEHNSNYVNFEICSSNDKIYMLTKDLNNGKLLLEFNIMNYEWRTLTRLQQTHPLNGYLHISFFLIENKIYFKNDTGMMIMCMDTYQIMKDVEMPHTFSNKVTPLVMNGLIYMVHITEPACINIHYYDEGQDMFPKIMEKKEVGRVDIAPLTLSEHGNVTHAWSNNNKIYVAIVSRKRILITCFDVDTRQCDTVMESYYGDDYVTGMFSRDYKVYMISKRFLDVVIQEIDMDPSLETIALVNMAEVVVDDPVKKDTCENVIPYGLRTQFKSIVNRKSQLSFSGKLQMLTNELLKLKTDEGNNVAKLMELQRKTDMEKQQLFWNIEFLLYNIRKMIEAIGKMKEKIVKLQSRFRIELDGQPRGKRREMKPISDRDITIFERLSIECRVMIDQPNSPITYIVPMGTITRVREQQQRHIEDIAELEEVRNNQYELSIFDRQDMDRLARPNFDILRFLNR